MYRRSFDCHAIPRRFAALVSIAPQDFFPQTTPSFCLVSAPAHTHLPAKKQKARGAVPRCGQRHGQTRALVDSIFGGLWISMRSGLSPPGKRKSRCTHPPSGVSGAPAKHEALAKVDIHDMLCFAVRAPELEVISLCLRQHDLVGLLFADRADDPPVFHLQFTIFPRCWQ